MMRKQLAAIGVAAACLFGLTGCISVNAAPHQTQEQRFNTEFKAKDNTGYTGSMATLQGIAKQTCSLMHSEGVNTALDDVSTLAAQDGIDSHLWAEVTYVGTDVYCHEYLDAAHQWAANQ